MHILLVEDDCLLADGIAKVLQGHGVVVDVVHTGSDADVHSRRAGLSAMVLDIGLPGGMDGFEVVRRVRARGDALPILLLTARDAIQDRVHGLEVGADDYLVKPFATAELLARLRALVRRSSAMQQQQVRIGRIALDTLAKKAWIADSPLELPAREWAILEYLVLKKSRVVSKQQIIDAILPWDQSMTLNAVEVQISRIRLKIAQAGVSIRTIRGFGYILEENADA